MKDFYIAGAAEQENKVITSSFVVASKQVKAKKTGEPYLALVLSDRTGQLEAKMWDNVAGVMEGFEQDDFVKVKGLLNNTTAGFKSPSTSCGGSRSRRSIPPTTCPSVRAISKSCGATWAHSSPRCKTRT